VLNLFMDLQQEFNTAYVFISHNLAVVRHVADHVMVMYLGRPVEMGPKEDIYTRPLHPYTQALLSATPTIHPDPDKPKIKIVGELPNPLNPPPAARSTSVARTPPSVAKPKSRPCGCSTVVRWLATTPSSSSTARHKNWRAAGDCGTPVNNLFTGTAIASRLAPTGIV
jgi:oligopeptide/dipeptide ABC transporter ATP-binding protein